jgi:hypothetical protein
LYPANGTSSGGPGTLTPERPEFVTSVSSVVGDSLQPCSAQHLLRHTCSTMACEEISMATRTDFTETEWKTLEKGVTGAGMLVSLADANLFDSFKEAGALAGHLNEARQKSPSTLVRDLATTHNTGFGFGSSLQEVESETTVALQSAVKTLQEKAPDETEAYRTFVVEVAQSVAKAVSGVSSAETAALDKIQAALQTT